MRFLRFVPLAGAFVAAGCASTGEYPSLAQRPAERVEGTFAPDTPEPAAPPPAPPSADLVSRLDQLTRDARAADAAFRAATPTAERLSRSAGTVGSDSWASAQVALANLDSIRSTAAVSLADLDALWIDATVDSQSRDAIGIARDSVQALLVDEDTVLARLRGRL